MDINFIEIMLSNYATFKIESNNILECNCMIESETVEENINNKIENVPIVKSLLLVIKDYENIIGYDYDDVFDLDNEIISQISIYYKNGGIKSGYIDEKFSNQIHTISEDRMYITIDDKK